MSINGVKTYNFMSPDGINEFLETSGDCRGCQTCKNFVLQAAQESVDGDIDIITFNYFHYCSPSCNSKSLQAPFSRCLFVSLIAGSITAPILLAYYFIRVFCESEKYIVK